MRFRTCALLAVFLFAACASPETFRVESPAAGTWTSLPLRVEGHRPAVELEVNGRRVPVLLDLGAAATVWLEPAAAEAAAVWFTGGTASYTDAFGREHPGRRYVIGECLAGDVVLRDVEGREAAVSLLGWRLLRAFRVLVDAPGKRVVLAAGSALPPDVHPETWVRVPFRATGYGIATDAVVAGRAVELVWDTGASRSILKPGRGSGACALSLGGHDFGTEEFVELDLAEPPGDGLVGWPFFARHRVLIDWEAGILAIESDRR